MTNLTKISRTAEKYHMLMGYLCHVCKPQQHKLSQKREQFLHYETICINKRNCPKYNKTNVLSFTHAVKHTTLICMHTAIYYSCTAFKFQKTGTSLITKVTCQLNVMQSETNHCHQTVLFGPYLQKSPILNTFLGFCISVVEVTILLGYDTASLGNWAPKFQDGIMDLKCWEQITQLQCHIPEEQRPQTIFYIILIFMSRSPAWYLPFMSANQNCVGILAA